ncbi:uncharacterized protein LOC106012029 [Aplysia californica]|uniref:Uncharacterized protein LOC106012029 n=1 Tax=Aplysia californica TaxID=6500 RepID=A0ABM1A1T4_APLCA|nr:uncharacterized protein LOC106012029 [Aplysia californica]
MRRTLPLSFHILVGIAVVVVAAAADDMELPENLTDLDYENISISDLLIEIGKAIPQHIRQKGTIFNDPSGFSCNGQCGTLSKGLCSCRPTCVPAGNCCYDFQAECPLQFERLETDLWWLRFLEMSCLPNRVMAVSYCPRPGSAIHKDQFTPEVKTPTSSQQKHFDQEWQEALTEGKEDPPLRTFKKREAVVWKSGASLTLQVGEDRKRRRRFVDGRVPQEDGLAGSDTSPKPDSPTTPVVATDAYGETGTLSGIVQPMSLSDNGDTVSKDDASMWTTHRTSSIPGFQGTIAGQGSQVDRFRHVITDLPITDVDTGLVFISASVFACHNHFVKNPAFWDVMFVPNTGKGVHGQAEMEEIIKEIPSPSSAILPSVGTAKNLELCYGDEIVTCRDNYSNQFVLKRCHDTMAFILYKGRIYKNPFCVVCNFTPLRALSYVPLRFFLQGRAIGIFHIIMKVKPDFQSVTFALSTEAEKTTRSSMLYPNWREYECQLNYRELAESLAAADYQDTSEGQSSSSTEIEEEEKRPEGDALQNSQFSLLESNTTKQNLDHCKLLSCRVGKMRDNNCEAEWYVNFRFPPVSKPLCPEFFNAMEPLILTSIHQFEQKLFSPSSTASLLGVYKGGYVYQYVFTGRSFFDLSLDRSVVKTIKYVISSVLFSASPPLTNVSFCVFQGLNTHGPIPKHNISSCSKENEEAPGKVSSSSFEVTCSSQERNYIFSWVCIVTLIMTVAYMTQ